MRLGWKGLAGIGSAIFFGGAFIAVMYGSNETLSGGVSPTKEGAAIFYSFTALAFVIPIYLGVRGRKPSKKQEITDVNVFTRVGVVKEVEFERSGGRLDVKPDRIDYPYPEKLDFPYYMGSKGPNHNVTITGASRGGKSELAYFVIGRLVMNKIIFQYKDSDKYIKLGYPVISTKDYVPNVFDASDVENFTQAWKVTAGNYTMRGMTVGEIIPLVRSIRQRSHSWQEFKVELEAMMKLSDAHSVKYAALLDIKIKLEALYSEKQYNLPIPDSCVIDFSGLNEEAFSFYAEFLMRTLYSQIKGGKRVKTTIVVDEAKVFLQSEYAIINELAAQIGSKGNFIVSTQRLASIKGDVLANAGSQFCFRLTSSEDLFMARALSEEYQWILQRLKPGEFVDLAQHDSHLGIFVFKIINPSPRTMAPIMLTPTTETLASVSQPVNPPPKSPKLAEETSEGKGKEINKEDDLTQEVYKIICMASGNVQELARELESRGRGKANAMKMEITKKHGPIETLLQEHKISYLLYDYIKIFPTRNYTGTSKLYYKSHSYGAHDYIVRQVNDLLQRKGIKSQILQHGESTPDIIVEEPSKTAYEIETGTKYGDEMDTTEQRIRKQIREGYRVVIIVPTKDKKDKFKGMSDEIYTVRELYEVLEQETAKTEVEEGEENEPEEEPKSEDERGPAGQEEDN